MKDAAVDFCMGTFGTVPLPPILANEQNNASSRTSHHCEKVKADDSEIFVEELKLPEILLRSPLSKAGPEKSGAVLNSQRDFVQIFQQAATKRDQFLQMKSFESGVLQIQDAEEEGPLSRKTAIQQLERNLKEVKP